MIHHLRKLFKIIQPIINFIFYHDKDIFYGRFLGSIDLKHLILENLLRPGRSLRRLQHNRLFPIKFKVNNTSTSINVSALNTDNESLLNNASKVLDENGAVIIDSYFSRNKIQDFIDYYDFNSFLSSSEIANKTHSTDTLIWSKALFDLWFDDLIINIIKDYIGKIPFARGYPLIQCHKPLKRYSSKELYKSPDSSKLADRWHYDHQCIIQAAVYLDECLEDGTRMQIIPGSNRLPNVGSNQYSEEYFDKRNIPIVNCFGGKGSIQIHCGNTIHRNFPVPGKDRSWIKFEFTSGNNILLSSPHIGESYNPKYNLNNINESQRYMLKGLFPTSLFKGYTLNSNDLREEKFTGV